MFAGLYILGGQHTTLYPLRRNARVRAGLQDIRLVLALCLSLVYGCVLQAPEGFLESQFITPVAKKYLNFASNSILSPALSRRNPPKGLYALIAAAVRCFLFLEIVPEYLCLEG